MEFKVRQDGFESSLPFTSIITKAKSLCASLSSSENGDKLVASLWNFLKFNEVL